MLVQLSEAYACKASPLHQALDTMAVGTLAMATVLVVYMLVFGTFPFNAAISGIASCLGFCILTGETLPCGMSIYAVDSPASARYLRPVDA